MPAKCTIKEKLDRRIARGGAEDCWNWTGAKNRQGYGQICHLGRGVLAHRAAYENAFGVSPGTLVVMHKCDNPSCCNPRHLLLGTVRDNNNDRHRKNRSRGGSSLGECNPVAKITAEQARAIFLDPRPHNHVAAEYGIAFQTVHNIRARKSWGHATRDLSVGYARWRSEQANARAGSQFR